MATAQNIVIQRYQQPLWGTMDRVLKNCFVGSSILGVLLLIAIFVVPKPAPHETTIQDVPERFARLILEKPKPVAPPAPDRVAVETPAVEPKPEIKKPEEVKKPPRRRTSKPKVAKDAGAKGRTKAQQEVTQNLAQVTGSLDKALDNLSSSLKTSTSGDSKPKSKRRRRGVRSGRSSDQLAAVGGSANLSAPDVSKSAIISDGVSIASITDLTVQDGAGSDLPASGAGGGGIGGTRSDLRSNESLLSTVRRYAPGIQFCYDNELKKNPSLRGKLVVNITVLANGAVSDAIVVDDTLGSRAVTNCVLAQIRGWQFPAIPDGTMSFKTPFVFTPPE